KPEDYFYSAGTNGPASKYSLGAVGSKFRTDTLVEYLKNPLKTSPAGRMPHLLLSDGEAQDIARFLCRITDETIAPAIPSGKGRNSLDIAATVLKAAGA